ncbi:hypothetical protein CKO15_11495 [Halorhodospira abdelmalekii]|uniref:Smr/MutS family protein n=1 Tax=Halorhodospira abdelmalekii TaxID=421629 RepID=UPI001903587A|nr:Smr/MutS family protein [Halorhodospira abdelmalekii]MBK1735889.1 hypothetical protein [Halorhodospira abdelmalekii]
MDKAKQRGQATRCGAPDTGDEPARRGAPHERARHEAPNAAATDPEAELFRAAVVDARPLPNDRADTRRRRPPPRPLQFEADEQRVLDELLAEPADPSRVESGDELSFCRPGVQRRVIQRLRRGHYSPEAHLDLHGQTRRQAHASLSGFLKAAQQRGIRCVRIVHGKGRGSRSGTSVIKSAVDGWLRRRDEILAFASAPPRDGGTGALYVLLRAPAKRP